MGDRGQNRHGPKRGGAAVPFSQGELGPSDVYLRIKWYLDPSSRLATIDMGRKLGGRLSLFLGGSWVPV